MVFAMIIIIIMISKCVYQEVGSIIHSLWCSSEEFYNHIKLALGPGSVRQALVSFQQ